MEDYRIVKNNLWNKVLYHPEIEGKDNIPTDEGIIFCGNHLSDVDGNIIARSSDRNICLPYENKVRQKNFSKFIEYLANNGSLCFFADDYRLIKFKLESLRNKECEILNNNSMRSGDCSQAMYLISKEKEYYEKIISLFNEEKANNKYQFIMPFGKDAFILAREMGFYIVPFALSGEYNNVKKVSFGESFPVYDIDETKKKVEDTVKKLIKRNSCM